MKKKSLMILFASLIVISSTACKGKVERVESNEETKEETVNGYTKEELEESALPEDVFDEGDAVDNSQENEELTEEEVEAALEQIKENYGGDGPIILPEDVWE